jgi:hypothetical protein
MTRRALWSAAVAALAAPAVLPALGLAPATFACGSALSLPEVGEHKGETPTIVPFPPPPPQVQLIPEKPAELKRAVWVDGQWVWRTRRWEWQEGKWQVPYKGARYAAPVIVYLPDKKIGWIGGHFHHDFAP